MEVAEKMAKRQYKTERSGKFNAFIWVAAWPVAQHEPQEAPVVSFDPKSQYELQVSLPFSTIGF